MEARARIHDAFTGFSERDFADGALPAKTKQLIAVAWRMSPNVLTESVVILRRRCGTARRRRG